MIDGTLAHRSVDYLALRARSLLLVQGHQMTRPTSTPVLHSFETSQDRLSSPASDFGVPKLTVLLASMFSEAVLRGEDGKVTDEENSVPGRLMVSRDGGVSIALSNQSILLSARL